MGRPRSLSEDRVNDLVSAFERYIAETPIPIIVEFAYQNGIARDIIYDYDAFTTLRKMAIDKKEAQLERLALQGEIDKTMAIFSLKQLGWSDRQAVEHSGQVEGKLVIVRADKRGKA